MDLTEESLPPPELSVIIPARNEERALPACLASLLRQTEPGFALGEQWELIVVDDASTDGTRNLADAAAAGQTGVRVLQAPPLDLGPLGGFTGKNNACWAGAQTAHGRWLLFSDADTMHEPGGLSRSLREAERHKVALLSYSPRQIVTGFWQRAVMPLVYSELASVYPSRLINDPRSRLAAASGAFLLVERDTYFAVGGHRMIGTEVLEDVALARNVKRRGPGKDGQSLIRFRLAPEALSIRMYPTTTAMVEGWRKNLARLMPDPLRLAFFRMLDLLLYFGLPVAAMLVPPKIPYQGLVFLLLWVRTAFRFYNRVMRSGFGAVDTTLSILGVPLFAYVLVRSVIDHRINKTVTWKGRNYTAGR